MRGSGILGAALALACATVPGGSGAETLRVAQGGSIAAALGRAQPGDVIEVEPGTYRESLAVDTPRITLRGLVRGDARPVLDGGGELVAGVVVSGANLRMSGFRVQHYRASGVTARGASGVTLNDLVVDDTGLYGVRPVDSNGVSVTHCTITRMKDAAIYLGDSSRALVAYNEVHHNVVGIAVANSDDVEVRDNLVYDNTTGILVFVRPRSRQKGGNRTTIQRNWVTRNNTPNFGDPSVPVGRLPHGGGILVMGADATLVENNWIKENQSFGIGVVRLAADRAAEDPELEPLSDRSRIGDNYLFDNGRDPHPFGVERFGGGADLAWDGTGEDNCITRPEHARYRGGALPHCRRGVGQAEPGAPGAAP
jgi:parallel beta-helix repeat protein